MLLRMLLGMLLGMLLRMLLRTLLIRKEGINLSIKLIIDAWKTFNNA
jgi:hypothetical protein